MFSLIVVKEQLDLAGCKLAVTAQEGYRRAKSTPCQFKAEFLVCELTK